MTESLSQLQPLETQWPFRFGVVTAEAGRGADWTATARRLESAGFSSLLVPDTLDGPAPLIALAAAAAATSTLRLGSFVMVAGLRPPGLLAWEAGTLHVLSDGRFELGLGLGRPAAETDAQRLGIPFGAAGKRVERMVEALDAVQALPRQRRPPILIAAAGPRMLQLAGQRADTVALGLSPLATPEELARAAGKIRWAAQQRPRPPSWPPTCWSRATAMCPTGYEPEWASTPARCGPSERQPCWPATRPRWPTPCCAAGTRPGSATSPAAPTWSRPSPRWWSGSPAADVP